MNKESMRNETLKDKVIALLKDKDGLTDREITNALLGVNEPQQAVNQVCRIMMGKGILERNTRKDGLLGNFLNSESALAEPVSLQNEVCISQASSIFTEAEKEKTKMNFDQRIKKRLALYKNESYPDVGNGKWDRNQKEYEHILPAGYEQLNYLSPYREELLRFISQSNFKLHSPTHMNSSQIMCLNFFYPLITEGILDRFSTMINLNVPVSEAKFEYVPEKNEGTNIDFFLKFDSGKKILFEIKYGETDFGSRSYSRLKRNDQQKYEKKYMEIYEPNLRSKIHPAQMSIHTVLNNYQLTRNVYHLNADDLFIVVAPEGNVLLKRIFDRFHTDVLNESVKKQVRFVTWEEMVLGTNKWGTPRIIEQLNEFEEKYLKY